MRISNSPAVYKIPLIINFIPTLANISKILIVDDPAETRRMERCFLDDLPFEFEERADGADAVDCYEKTRPDWVLTDWEMRRMNRLEAPRRIVEKHPQARIVIITQHDAQLRAAALNTNLNNSRTAIIANDNTNTMNIINNDNANTATLNTAITNVKNEILADANKLPSCCGR